MAKESTIKKLITNDTPTKWVQEMVGERFNKLTVLRGVGYRKNKSHYYIECACDCGVVSIKKAESVKAGSIVSCGCEGRVAVGNANRTHGESCYNKKNKIFNAWTSIKDRCFYKNEMVYCNYGGRGITMCDGLRGSYLYFKEQLGEPPTQEHTVDRVDNNLNYSCGKCGHCEENGWGRNIRWADRITQANNKRNNVFGYVDGERMTAAQAARKLGKKYGMHFIYKFKRGDFNTPIIKHLNLL